MLASDPDSQKLIEYYRGLLEQHGPTEAALGCTKSKQILRFRAASRHTDFKDQSVLDVGCGFGDFLSYLVENAEVPGQYLGLDLMPDFIAQANKMASGKVSFRVSDFFLEEEFGDVDIVGAFGIFNHLAEKSEEEGLLRLDAFLAKASKLARKVVLVDFLSDRVDFRRNPDKDRHWSPGQVLQIATKYSQSVVLDHSYLPFEFMLVIHPKKEIDRKDAIFCS